MTNSEARKIIAVMMQVWKNYDPRDIDIEAALLTKYLGEYDYGIVNAALDECILHDKYAPNIARLKKAAEWKRLGMKYENLFDFGENTGIPSDDSGE